jgi:hypothetical protein
VRIFFCISPAVGLVFFCDGGKGLPGVTVASDLQKIQEFLPEELQRPEVLPHPVERLPVDDYRPNKIFCKCSKCGARVSRGTGYKQHYKGLKQVFCPKCQLEAGQPLR